MTAEEIIRLLFSFLGGGLVAGLLEWFRSNRSERKAQRIASLSAQIQKLYGPLQFFASQNESFFELNDKFHKAYKLEYEGVVWSTNEMSQKNRKEQQDTFFDIANSYVIRTVENNESILSILRDNYSYIDPDDIEIFRRFIVDYTRLKKERDESGRLRTPYDIYRHVGEISFMKPEFIKRVNKKFIEKKQLLDSLTN